jgi:hypothetical protein
MGEVRKDELGLQMQRRLGHWRHVRIELPWAWLLGQFPVLGRAAVSLSTFSTAEVSQLQLERLAPLLRGPVAVGHHGDTSRCRGLPGTRSTALTPLMAQCGAVVERCQTSTEHGGRATTAVSWPGRRDVDAEVLAAAALGASHPTVSWAGR